MDFLYRFRGQAFIWDAMKAMENRAKHGFRFEEACEVFFDPLQESEDASVEGEEQLAVIGKTLREDLLYVVHVEREESQLRIISAREVSPRERNLYEDGC